MSLEKYEKDINNIMLLIDAYACSYAPISISDIRKEIVDLVNKVASDHN